jgi:hypothetical protein
LRMWPGPLVCPGPHQARTDAWEGSNWWRALRRHNDHRNRRLPNDLSGEPAAQDGPRFSFASRTEEDENSPLVCRDRSESLGDVANLGSPVDAANELLVVEDVREKPLGVSPRTQDRGRVGVVIFAEAVRYMNRDDSEAEGFGQLRRDAEC